MLGSYPLHEEVHLEDERVAPFRFSTCPLELKIGRFLYSKVTIGVVTRDEHVQNQHRHEPSCPWYACHLESWVLT